MANLKVPITDDDHVRGNTKAPLTLVKYGDFECPACGKSYYIIKQIQAQLGEKLRLVFRNFPLTEIHPYAEMAAEAAEFAGSHGLYWEMYDLLFTNQSQLDVALLLQFAESLHLSVKDLQNAFKNKKFKEKIQHDFIGGVYSGVNGTPTLFINGECYVASLTFEKLLEFCEDRIKVLNT